MLEKLSKFMSPRSSSSYVDGSETGGVAGRNGKLEETPCGLDGTDDDGDNDDGVSFLIRSASSLSSFEFSWRFYFG